MPLLCIACKMLGLFTANVCVFVLWYPLQGMISIFILLLSITLCIAVTIHKTFQMCAKKPVITMNDNLE